MKILFFKKKKSDLQAISKLDFIFDTMCYEKLKITVANRGLYKNWKPFKINFLHTQYQIEHVLGMRNQNIRTVEMAA